MRRRKKADNIPDGYVSAYEYARRKKIAVSTVYRYRDEGKIEFKIIEKVHYFRL
jgi:hypothetical protein